MLGLWRICMKRTLHTIWHFQRGIFAQTEINTLLESTKNIPLHILLFFPKMAQLKSFKTCSSHAGDNGLTGTVYSLII